MRRVTVVGLHLPNGPVRQNGRPMAMITAIDSAGRIVIPKALRDRLDLAPA
jgi:hypothetical protein